MPLMRRVASGDSGAQALTRSMRGPLERGLHALPAVRQLKTFLNRRSAPSHHSSDNRSRPVRTYLCSPTARIAILSGPKSSTIAAQLPHTESTYHALLRAERMAPPGSVCVAAWQGHTVPGAIASATAVTCESQVPPAPLCILARHQRPV
jgi:hypothetical protein